MAELITSQNGTIQAPIGSGFAIYKDGNSGEIMLKDLRGNTQPLSDFFKNNEEIYLIDSKNSIFPNFNKNQSSGENSVTAGGDYNINRGLYSVIAGGNSNTTARNSTVVSGGSGNDADADFSVVSGGQNNKANGLHSSISGGFGNNIKEHTNSHIVGSKIEADRDNTTFVNNLSIKDIPTSADDLPKGSIWSDNGILKIVS